MKSCAYGLINIIVIYIVKCFPLLFSVQLRKSYICFYFVFIFFLFIFTIPLFSFLFSLIYELFSHLFFIKD